LQRQHTGLAVVLILIGVFFLLANLGLFGLDIGNTLRLWPIILMGLGLWMLFIERKGSVSGPVVLIGLGTTFLLTSLDVLAWGSAWPLFVVVAGVAILLQGVQFGKGAEAPVGEDTVNLVAIFSGAERRISSKSFHGGKVTAMFGGSELDLRSAELAPGATLNISAMFGGVEMRVPQKWRVDVHGTAMFGGIENKQGQPEDPNSPVLTVNASVMFGGLEVKN